MAALAIIRIGAVFIPGDSAVPPEKRLEYVVLAEVKHLICERPVAGLPESVTVICQETMPQAPADTPLGPACEWLASEMACVFFSSGSTGLPKGVRHSAVFWFELVGIQYFDAATEVIIRMLLGFLLKLRRKCAINPFFLCLETNSAVFGRTGAHDRVPAQAGDVV